ncbi:hypothetical protein EFK50_01060 [Nocardioides marmoriginsengisoli]|uniref:Uncharacterized protein n=1 Tax=Nocardioides marmoriginsengisoli TaxID=661483 RepID=A0A3N0CTB5_9ACTN|nr:hypothetical protein [Nocardioides marmoriginsengisoli]RNL66246.1 hypothetical protein EFK50_01060 [Nocardioides marmoriginsengisoli]
MSDPIQIITGPELASYPGAGSPSAADARTYAVLVNGVVTEAWKNPVEPVPAWVRAIAFEVGARASRNPKGLQSWTRSVDDASRTERYSEQGARAGIYLTPEEAARLGGTTRRRKRYGTIRVRQGF